MRSVHTIEGHLRKARILHRFGDREATEGACRTAPLRGRIIGDGMAARGIMDYGIKPLDPGIASYVFLVRPKYAPV